ncbi:MAG: tetratricopeptide repeat protein, partial [Planctomycetota bacterium]
DTFDYIQAAAAFALRDFDAALALCRRLITHDYGVHANPGPAMTAALGHHMTAQIHHARGELDRAVESYRKVREQFTDAARALRFLQREGLRMPELTVVRGAEPVRLEVEHRGTDALVVQVYPVDLRMLLMTHRDGDGLAAVNLAGVKPAVVQTVRAGAAGGKGGRAVELALPKVGAYLVVVRAGSLRARGLVVRSDLTLEVQPAGNDAFRVNVVSAGSGAYVARAAVTFIGSSASRIVSRQTDLRGICEAGGLAGRVSIVAEHEGHYAVHTAVLKAPQAGEQAETDNNEEFEQEKADEPMSRLQDRLKDIRGKNEQAWKSNTTKQQKGVEAGRAKK